MLTRESLPLLVAACVFALLALGLAGFGALCLLAFGKLLTGAICYGVACLAGWQTRSILCEVRLIRATRDE